MFGKLGGWYAAAKKDLSERRKNFENADNFRQKLAAVIGEKPTYGAVNSLLALLPIALQGEGIKYDANASFLGVHKNDPLTPPPGFQTLELKGPRGQRYAAWYKPAKPGHATVACFHGISGSLNIYKELLSGIVSDEHGKDNGCGAIIVAYPGFKGSEIDVAGRRQHPSEAGCNHAGHAMLRTLEQDFHIPIEDTVIFGISLGVAVGLRAMRERQEEARRRVQSPNPVAAWQNAHSNSWLEIKKEENDPDPILLHKIKHVAQKSISRQYKTLDHKGFHAGKPFLFVGYGGFSTLKKRIRDQYPHFPVLWLSEEFNAEKEIARVEARVRLFHGTDDKVTHHKHSQHLANIGQAHGRDVKFIEFEGGNHWLAPQGTQPEQIRDVTVDPREVRRLLSMVNEHMHGWHERPRAESKDSPKPADSVEPAKSHHGLNGYSLNGHAAHHSNGHKSQEPWHKRMQTPAEEAPQRRA